ncbi:MAG TPA: CdaR family protein [Pyrinomonadaceae bacterium]|nr:CdaR family protein [Pyrinomonadaceae bacterium]
MLRKIFLEDWGLKLIALVVTLALWLGVTGLSTPTTKRFTVPLSYSISNDIEITNTPIQEVDIVITGDKRKIDQINRSELSALIDISELPPGDKVLQLTPENVRVTLPQGVKLDEVQPSRIAVRLETVEEKDIEVRPQLAGQPATGYEVYDTSVTPARVRVRGPASYVKTLDFVPTGEIDVNGASQDLVAKQVPVSVPNPRAAVFSTVVDVNVRIGELRVRRLFNITTPAGKHVSAVLFGPKSMLADLQPDQIKVELLKNETGSETPSLTLPGDLQQNVRIESVKLRS